MSKRNYLGIDPGKSGAIAIINEDGLLIHVTDTPMVGKEYNLGAINDLVAKHEITFAVIEQQQVFGKEGRKTAFTIGFGYGLLLMALESNKIPHAEIRPPAWKKSLTLLKKEKADSVRLAQKLFPTGEFVTPRGALKDGRAEACLIAEYARRMNLNGEF
jgi:Holliday junction resolvasome RuvABC endonuclease subunit